MMTFDIDFVDPALATLAPTWMIEYATCATLYSYPDKPGSEGAKIIPEVAAGFPKIAKDGKTFTIDLKKTYRFHNGGQVAAANFVEAFNRDAHPRMQSPARTYTHEIVGADAVTEGKARLRPPDAAIGDQNPGTPRPPTADRQSLAARAACSFRRPQPG